MNSPITKKISVMILVISLGSILSSGLFINFALNRQFQSYLSRMDQTREDQVVNMLTEIYREYGGWPDRPTGLSMVRGNFLVNLMFVTDEYGKVVFYTRNSMRHDGPMSPNFRSRPIEIGSILVGTAYFAKNPVEDALSHQNNLFRATINRSILMAILFTGIVSFLIALIFARRIATPIRAMNRIAKDMTAGNLDTRIQSLPQDELGELGQSLNQLAQRLKEVEALRKKMTADVAHDLRTPLTTVRSHLEGMIDEVIPASTANLESLLDEVDRLNRLVRDLQEIALADSAIHHFNHQAMAIDEFLMEFIKRQRPLFMEKDLNLIYQPSGSALIHSDRDALTKILDNLLSNAYKYTPSGRQVTVGMVLEPNWVAISVSDEGIGIDSADLPFIFERFYRTDRSRNRNSGGFGLGLTIVKELVEALGGTLNVVSEPEKGSCFTVRLPRFGKAAPPYLPEGEK